MKIAKINMEKKNETNLILEDYKTHFYYQKSNLNIQGFKCSLDSLILINF